MKPPALKLGPWDIWTGGEHPPDQPTGGMSTGSSYRWIRWEGGPWIQCELPLHRLLRLLAYIRPWDYDEPQRDDCPDCGGAWNKMEHREDCPRGRALRLMDNSEPEIREQARVLLDLPEGWDSYGAKRVDPKSAQLAVRVAMALNTIADFRMVPMTSGGVALEAHDGGQDVEIEIETAGTEPGVPWWEPRPWGEEGPPRELGHVDVFGGHWSGATLYRDGWRYDVSGGLVRSATHWRPEGPPPSSIATPGKEQP